MPIVKIPHNNTVPFTHFLLTSISSTIMFSSFLLFTMLLAFKQTHLYSFTLSKLFFADFFLLSLSMPLVFGFSVYPPCETSLKSCNLFRCPSIEAGSRRTLLLLSALTEAISHIHVFFPNKISPQIYKSNTFFLTHLLY